MPLTLKQLSILHNNITYYKSLVEKEPLDEQYKTMTHITKQINDLIRKRSLVCSEEERSSYKALIFDASI